MSGVALGGVSVEVQPLKFREDVFNGVIILPDFLPADDEHFLTQLNFSLQVWNTAGKRGIWLQVPISRASLIPLAVNHAGFKFHHAEPDYVMMTKWLPSAPSMLPANASHQVGVGAFVLDAQGRVLVVQEGHGHLKGKGVWKIPTGLTEAGEDLIAAVQREVLEETAVRIRVASVLAIRQTNGGLFGKNDLFFLCAGHAEPGEQEVVVQESELDAACWLPLEQYAQQDFLTRNETQVELLRRCQAWARGEYPGLAPRYVNNKFMGKAITELLL